MSSEWPLVPVGEVAQLFDGPHATPKKTDDGPVFLGISSLKRGQLDLSSTEHLSEEDFSKWTRRVTPQTGDVVFSYETRIGEVAIIPEGLRCCLGRRMALLRPDQTRLLPKYLLYYFLSDEFQCLLRTRTIHGSTVDRLPLKDFPTYPVRVPSIEVQRLISEVLEAFDKRIALLRETNATLEALAQALFKSWFVDFDPVRAKTEGRQPEGMDATTAALFPDSFEESELGLVPKGWKVGTLGDIARTARQQMQVSELHADLNYVGLEHIPRKSLSLTSWGNAEGLESAKAAFSEGDILFGKLRPYFHKVVISPFAGVCSTDILVCQPKIQNYFGVVAMHLFSETLINYANRLSNGAKMPRVNWKDLAAYHIVIPPAELAEKLNEAIHPLIARMMENTHQAQTLTQLRDTLLPRLIAGTLRLPEAETLLETMP